MSVSIVVVSNAMFEIPTGFNDSKINLTLNLLSSCRKVTAWTSLSQQKQVSEDAEEDVFRYSCC